MNHDIDELEELDQHASVAAIEPEPKGEFKLSPDQQDALEKIQQFLMDPAAKVFVLSGYSGCGKSTLVQTVLDRMPAFLRTARLINPSLKDFQIRLTATTNKAAENLAQITGSAASTIHSAIGLRVKTDYTTGKVTLEENPRAEILEDYVIFVDESSYVDSDLLGKIFKRTKNCKIIFVGDPAQLTPVKSANTPVFDAGFPSAALTQVMRQAEGNPIIELATKFRHTVNTGEFFQFTPDGDVIRYLERSDFNAALLAEFSRPNWRYSDSKFLAWTNKRVIEYNHYVRERVKGQPTLQDGDYAMCNSFVLLNGKAFKTDQMVMVTQPEPATEHGVAGMTYRIDGGPRGFMPNDRDEAKKRLAMARSRNEYSVARDIESSWLDLRAAYACTINKAQGSTYNQVFIDLDDIRRCNSGDQIARMLYVGVSRARHHVYLTGDLI